MSTNIRVAYREGAIVPVANLATFTCDCCGSGFAVVPELCASSVPSRGLWTCPECGAPVILQRCIAFDVHGTGKES